MIILQPLNQRHGVLSKQVQPDLSVVLITFNRANLLKECLSKLAEAILKVDKFKIEVLLADNASSDETPNICAEWVSKNQARIPIQIIRHPNNLGAVPSMFKAMKKATGKYLLFLGDDDGLFSRGLSQLLSQITSGPSFSIGIEGDFRTLPEDPLYIPYEQLLGEQTKHFATGSMFYKAGNAWAGIYNTDEVVRIFKSNEELTFDFQGSNWGQSSLAGLIASTSNLPVAIFGGGFGGNISTRPFAQGGLSIANSLSGLVAAGVNLRARHESGLAFLTSIVATKNSPVNNHLLILLGTTPREIDAEVTRLVSSSRQTLRNLGIHLPIYTKTLFALVCAPWVKLLLTKARARLLNIDLVASKFNENHY